MSVSKEVATGVDRAAAIEGIVDTLAASRVRSIVAIVIVALVAFLPGINTISPLDRDEPRFALGTKLMLETGDLSDGGHPDGLRFTRPIGMNWLQLVSVSLFGDGATSPIGVYRLPSLFGAIAVSLLTWWMAIAFGRPRAALLAAVLVAVSPLLVGEAHLAKADAVLLAAIVLAQGALARLWMRKIDAPDYWLAFLFWTALGLGILVKGLVAPMVIGLTVVTISAVVSSFAWLRRLAPLPGSIWLVISVAPWIIAVLSGVGGSLVEGALPVRLADQQVYEAPPGTYAILFYPLFGPAGVFVALAIPGVLNQIRRPVFLFAVAWIVPFWLVMELLPTKLPYYILPAYPALALIGATAIDEGRIRVTGWVSTYFSFNLLVWPVVVGGGAVVLFYLAEKSIPFFAIPFFLASAGVGAIAFRWLYYGRSIVGSALFSLLSAILVYVGLFGIVVAEFTALQISSRVVAAGRASVSCDNPEMVATGFAEPSLIFYAGNGIELTTPKQAVDFLGKGGCRTAFVEARRQSTFNQHAEDIGLELDVQREIRGFNIGNWKSIKLRVFAVDGGRP